jgi:hypothetical protein
MVGQCEKIEQSDLHPFDLEATTPKTSSAVAPPRPPLTSARCRKIEELASLGHLSVTDKKKVLDLLIVYKCL